ncbi:MAG: hypothetical protein ABEJ71_01180 [Halodesulfurarchaeum sp.]
MTEHTHHVTDRQLTAAIYEVGEPGSGGVPTLDRARSLLETVLSRAAKNLESYLDAVAEEDLQLVAVRPDSFLFADRRGRYLGRMLAAVDERTQTNEAVLRAVMRRLAAERAERDWVDADPIVIAKPEDWKRGEAGVERLFGWLLATGLTAEEAVDFWATAMRGRSARAWADRRDIDPETVREHVRDARASFGRDG